MREKYESLSVAVLRDVAKSRGLKHLSGLKKSQLVELMLEEDKKDAMKESNTEGKIEKKTEGKTTGSTEKKTEGKPAEGTEGKSTGRTAGRPGGAGE